ncbi:MAG: MarR family transcriptional regulator [Herbiconiux sp.]|nr:MarR family transcriptional regulator [Herbiconiux sp.]
MSPDRDEIDAIRERWAALRPGLDTEPIDLLGRILRAAALVGRRGDEFLLRYGLTRGEFDILSALRRGGAPQSPGSLRTVSLASGPAVTKRLRSLEARGLVERSANPADGRGALIALTGDGVALIDEVFPRLLEVERALLAAVPDAARPAAVTGLRAVLASIEAAPAAGPVPAPAGPGPAQTSE